MRTFRRALLVWARRDGRRFFWREPGLTPFAALVTEILLTKTRAALVDIVARRVLERYPTITKLADASAADLETLLFPLGLHRKRAASLTACAQAVRDRHGGVVPPTLSELLELPAIGRYAANAIACVVYDRQVAVLDANVSRIYQRVFSLPRPPDRLAAAHDLWRIAEQMIPDGRAKEYNWAILDLGGTICTAKAPRCPKCPIFGHCDRYGVVQSPSEP